VPAWPNISSSRPDVSISWPPGHSCPWEHFLSAAFSWTWQEESSALITCLGEAGFGLTQAKGFVCLWKAFAGAGWAIPGFGWHPGGDAGSAGWAGLGGTGRHPCSDPEPCQRGQAAQCPASC